MARSYAYLLHQNYSLICILLLLFGIFPRGKTENNQLTLDDLSDEELRETFGVEHAHNQKIPYHSVFIPHVKYAEGNEKVLESLSLRLDNQLLTLPLTSSFADLFGDTVAHINRHTNHSKLIIDSPKKLVKDCHYHSRNQNSIMAAISDCDGQLKGTIVTKNALYVVHPVPERHRRKRGIQNDDIGPHVIYKRDTFTAGKDFCEYEDSNEFSEEDLTMEDSFVVRNSDTTNDWSSPKRANLTVELALFVDEKLWTKFDAKYGSDADSTLRDFATTVFNNIQIMYQHPSISPSVTFKIVRYEVFKTQPVRLTGPYHNNGQAQEYLDKFCKYQQGLASKNWDHSFLLTGYDLHRSGSNSISGIARLHGMCDEWNACTLAEGIDFTSVFIGTHEFGHGVGMRHDEPYCESSYIMSSSLGPGKVSWSTCSMKDFHKFIDRLDRRGKNCMRRLTAYREPLTVQPQDMPGVRYTGDEQCTIMHGPGFRQVNPRQDNPHGSCNMMWCGQGSGRIITSHPALEGTNCFSGKWCVQGKCVRKTSQHKMRGQPNATPAVWSDWSKTSCSSCTCSTVSGAISILSSSRKCSVFGACHGASVRGIICGNKCHGTATVSDVMKNICTAHRDEKRDYELSGEGSQLTRNPKRACKVFCNIESTGASKRRTYRLFGDVLPDGTPCGWGSYCSAGECMPISCNKKALVDDPSHCPTTSETCTFTSHTNQQRKESSHGLWSEWNKWSMCSVTCGEGSQTRRRACSTSSCNGKAEDTRRCSERSCYEQYKGQWQTWQSWTSCSVSCGGGLRWRYRQCDRGNCDGDNSQQEKCAVVYCPWTSWTTCSRQCDSGVQKRRRDCSSGQCAGEFREERYCNTQSCSLWSNWNAWSLCSVSCGKGTRSRSRSCSGPQCPRSGLEEKREDCSLEYCPWESWTSCSHSCGQGTRNRYRKCPGGGCIDNIHNYLTNQENDNCYVTSCLTSQTKNSDNIVSNDDVVAIWASWGDWTECSVSCGEGMRARYRKCKDSLGRWSYDCFGADYKSEHCHSAECSSYRTDSSWAPWSTWSECSRTCGTIGIKSRWRACIGGDACSGAKDEELSCGSYDPCPDSAVNRRYWPAAKGQWSEWSLWGSCSVTCGVGSRTRSRNCFKGSCSGEAVQRDECRAKEVCPQWTEWGTWASCSRTCGGGTKQRTRSCNSVYGCAGKSYSTDHCSTWPCYMHNNINSIKRRDKSKWSDWTNWSSCSLSCGSGTKTRTRSCDGFDCVGTKIISEKCNTEQCASWGGWGEWSECTVTCGRGSRRRLRNCYGWGDCYGSKEESEGCLHSHCFA